MLSWHFDVSLQCVGREGVVGSSNEYCSTAATKLKWIRKSPFSCVLCESIYFATNIKTNCACGRNGYYYSLNFHEISVTKYQKELYILSKWVTVVTEPGGRCVVGTVEGTPVVVYDSSEVACACACFEATARQLLRTQGCILSRRGYLSWAPLKSLPFCACLHRFVGLCVPVCDRQALIVGRYIVTFWRPPP